MLKAESLKLKAIRVKRAKANLQCLYLLVAYSFTQLFNIVHHTFNIVHNYANTK